ncbi:hypothetical protein AB0L06_17165 [Spirillospora sp. NPDC052269]
MGWRNVVAVLMVAVCAVWGLGAVRRSEAAAPPTDLVLGAGYNEYGQLGDGNNADLEIPGPVALPAGVTVTQVVGGGYHSLALTSDGRVLAWGYNGVGQLGDGTTTDRLTPVEVHLPAGVTVTQIAAGHTHSLALTSDGRILAWGSNGAGQLGDGTYAYRTTPVETHLPAGVTATQVSAGYNHSQAATSDGRALAWGNNNQGRLGDGTTNERTTPVEVHVPPGVHVTQVSAGYSFGLAVTSGGRVLGWGDNTVGKTGDGTDVTPRLTPVQAQLPSGVHVTRVAAGTAHSLAVTSDGRALAWGANSGGQLGDGTTTDRFAPVEVHMPPGAHVTQVSAGWFHSLAATSDGRALAWGYNGRGPLGDGTTEQRETPVEMLLPEGTVATAVGAGSYHSLVLAEPIRSHASLYLVKKFDRFVEPAGSRPKSKARSRSNARMSAWREHDAVRYRFVVTNDGEVAISTITIHDSLTGSVSCASRTLEPGQSLTCYATHKVTSKEKSQGHVDNTATATGTRQDNGETVTSNKAHLRVDVTYR